LPDEPGSNAESKSPAKPLKDSGKYFIEEFEAMQRVTAFEKRAMSLGF